MVLKRDLVVGERVIIQGPSPYRPSDMDAINQGIDPGHGALYGFVAKYQKGAGRGNVVLNIHSPDGPFWRVPLRSIIKEVPGYQNVNPFRRIFG